MLCAGSRKRSGFMTQRNKKAYATPPGDAANGGKPMRSTKVLLLAAASGLILGAGQARADDYTDLLDVLKAKGSITKSDYRTLMAKHTHHGGAGIGGSA